MVAAAAKRTRKVLTVLVSEEEHRMIKQKIADHYGVTVSDVCRLALADDAMWKKAAEFKKKLQEKEDQK